eukprot:s293_g42.t1
MAAVMSRQNAFLWEFPEDAQVTFKGDGTSTTPALVSDGEGGGHEAEVPSGGHDGPPAGDDGETQDGSGSGEGGAPDGGDGGDGPHPDGEDEHKEDEEEEGAEKDPPLDPELPPTPEGSLSSSEPATDIILQKKHKKEVRRATAKSAVRLLDQTQEEIPQHLTISHMETTIAAQEAAREAAKEAEKATQMILEEVEKQKKKDDAAEKSSQRIQDEIQRRKRLDEQELRKQALLASIEEAKKAEKRQLKRSRRCTSSWRCRSSKQKNRQLQKLHKQLANLCNQMNQHL